MKKATALAVCALIVGANLRLEVPDRNQARAQEGTGFITANEEGSGFIFLGGTKRDQPKSLDDVRKLPQEATTRTATMGRPIQVRVVGALDLPAGHTSDPFETPGVPDPLPTLDGAKASVARLREMLKSSDEKERTKAKERAEDILTTYFLADMKARVVELDAIKQRVAEMEAQLEKRLQAQGEIVDLQKKVMQSDANGLEFFGPAGAAGGIGGGGGFGGGIGGGGAGGFGGATGGAAKVSNKEGTSDFVPAKGQSKTNSGR